MSPGAGFDMLSAGVGEIGVRMESYIVAGWDIYRPAGNQIITRGKGLDFWRIGKIIVGHLP